MRHKKIARRMRSRHGGSRNRPRVLVSFSTVTPESAEHGDFAETGWLDEQGHPCTPDKYDRAEGLTAADLAVKFIRDEAGGIEPSSSHFHRGVWYSETDGSQDYRSGETEYKAFHLKGFTEAQERAVFEALKR